MKIKKSILQGVFIILATFSSAFAAKPITYYNKEILNSGRLVLYIPDSWHVAEAENGWYTFVSAEGDRRMHFKIAFTYFSLFTSYKSLCEWGLEVIRKEKFPEITKTDLSKVASKTYHNKSHTMNQCFSYQHNNGAQTQIKNTVTAISLSLFGLIECDNYLMLVSTEAGNENLLNDPVFNDIIASAYWH